MDFIPIFLINGLVILCMMTFLWVLSLALKNSSIIDIFWGIGFVIAVWLSFFLTPEGFLARKLLLCIIVTVWGIRLAMYILIRNLGKPEDFRYQVWRKEAGEAWWWQSYFRVFLLQGILLWIISTPLVSAQFYSSSNQLTWIDILAISLWVVGFFFEAVGDWQLARFKSKPENKGMVLATGVWRYTRHPNYFGDATQWWAYYLLSLAAGSWWAIFSPLLMTTFLLRVSGVVLLENTLKVEKPDYQDYIKTTSAFIPWFPGKKQKL